MRYVCSFLTAVVLAAVSSAQGRPFQGELISDTPREFNQFTVELQSANGGTNPVERAYVTSDGRFEFRNIPAGQYLLTVRDSEGSAVHQQYTGAEVLGRWAIRLPEVQRQRPVSGLVSLQELQHQPPKAARKALVESIKRTQKGDTAGAIAFLERAVHTDPEFVPALNNLGSQYIRAGRYQEASQCFRRAIHLAPKTPMLHANLAQALLFLRDYAAAETSARAAIALDANDPMVSRAQLALGLALAGRGAIADARQLMVTCTHSADEAVRRAAEGYLNQLLMILKQTASVK